VRAWQQK